MKIRDMTITDTHGVDHYVIRATINLAENKEQTVFELLDGETITLEVERSDFVRGSFENDSDTIKKLSEQLQKANAVILENYRMAGTSAEIDFALWKKLEEYLGGREKAIALVKGEEAK